MLSTVDAMAQLAWLNLEREARTRWTKGTGQVMEKAAPLPHDNVRIHWLDTDGSFLASLSTQLTYYIYY